MWGFLSTTVAQSKFQNVIHKCSDQAIENGQKNEGKQSQCVQKPKEILIATT